MIIEHEDFTQITLLSEEKGDSNIRYFLPLKMLTLLAVSSSLATFH